MLDYTRIGGGVVGDSAHFLKSGRRIHSVKNRRPRHYPLHPGIYNLPKVFRGYATVDLDGEVQSPFLTPLAASWRTLWSALGMNCWPPNPGFTLITRT